MTKAAPPISRTGSGFVFGLRPEFSILQRNHDGNIDRSPFIAAGAWMRNESGVTQGAVVCIDVKHDFPEGS